MISNKPSSEPSMTANKPPISAARPLSELDFLAVVQDGLEYALFGTGDTDLELSNLLAKVRSRIQQINREEESE